MFELNLPRLQASEEYGGDYSLIIGTNNYFYERYCLMNFIFTDWEGNKHPFAISQSCSQPADTPPPYTPTTIGDATDGSFYRLDLSDLNNVKVISKDGTVYNFGYLPTAFPDPPNNGKQTNYENWFDSRLTSMTDTNGNTVSVSKTVSADDVTTYVVTDTLGRTFYFNRNGLTYTDSGGATKTIALNIATTGASVANVFAPGVSCQFTPARAGDSPSNPGSCNVFVSPGYQSYQATLTFPAADVTGTPRTLTIDLDSRERISKIVYPAGGYTAYDYADYDTQDWSQTTLIHYPMQEVYHKRECPSSGGSCSSEFITKYQPTIAVNDSTQAPYNSSIIVTDPLGNYSVHGFASIGAQQISPKETDVSKYDSGNNLLWSQHTVYTNPVNAGVGTDLYYPFTVTTTVHGPTATKISTTTYQYETYPAKIADGGTTTMYIDNPSQITETDYDGAPKRVTSEAWHTLGDFSAGEGHILDRLASKTVTDNVTNLQQTTTYTYDNGANTVGNLTSKVVGGTNAVSGTTSYVVNPYGETTQITDPNDNITHISYDDSNAWADSSCVNSHTTSAYPASVTNAKSQVVSYKYNSCLGTIASVSGPNTNQTTMYTYDALQRVIKVTYPDGGAKAACYFDSVPNTVATYTLQAIGATLGQCSSSTAVPAGNVADLVTSDGFGRKVESEILSDPSGADITSTSYDGDGNIHTVSNPYRASDSTYDTTTFSFDGLNRKTQSEHSDGTHENWSYDGNGVTYTDANGDQWQDTTDVWGHLTKVMEPNGSLTTPSMETDYSYDGLGDLISVNQCGGACPSSTGRVRSFTYNGLSQLITANNPETGNVCYGTWSGSACTNGYDADGNLLYKTDARGVTVKYTYEQLNRVSSKTYLNDLSGTPSSCYLYDGSSVTNGIGQLSNEWTQSSSTCATSPPTAPFTGIYTETSITAYDGLGRIKNEQQCTPATCSSGAPYSPAYTYDFAGNLLTATNGTTAVPTIGTLQFSHTYGGANRLLTVTSNDTNHPPSLFSAQPPASNAVLCPGANSSSPYTASGSLMNATLGNGITVSRTYDVRLRVTCEIDGSTE